MRKKSFSTKLAWKFIKFLILTLVITGCIALLIKENKTSIKYNRDKYQYGIDEDKDCQNTRAEVLIKTSLIEPKFKTERKCIVISGKWLDSYSGEYFYKAKRLEIDHLIPLKKAHTMGGYSWNEEKRKQFANDMENLIPVSSKLNQQKGSKGPRQWLPPNEKFQCEYVKKWITIQKKYDLENKPNGLYSKSLESIKDNLCRE